MKTRGAIAALKVHAANGRPGAASQIMLFEADTGGAKSQELGPENVQELEPENVQELGPENVQELGS